MNQADNLGQPVEKRAAGFKKARPRVIGRESYFEQILESLLDAVIMIDRTGRLVYVNRGARRMFGFKGQAVEKFWLADFCPADGKLPEKLAGYFEPHPPVEGASEGFFRRSNGEEFFAIFSISLFEPSYQEPCVLLTIKDFDYQRLMAAQLTSEQAQDLAILAITDPLTGLYNRRHFDRRLGEEFKRVERYDSPLTLIMLDFDHFKKINDQFGHLVGDQVLKVAADELNRGLRHVDILARWGGEEFMILLPETGAQTGLSVARRLHEIISLRDWSGLAPGLAVTASLGLVSLPWPNRPATLQHFLETLDRALYRAKDTGRNKIVRYLPEADIFADA